jgi:excisionase family DNA binding protein
MHSLHMEKAQRSQTGALMTVDEVAVLLQVSRDWVRDHSSRKQPRLPVIKVGKLLRFRPHEIERWIQEQCRRAC